MEPSVRTCDQCGAPYLDGVTICYSCGAPIGEAEQPTHPVAVPIHLRARVATVVMAPIQVPANNAEGKSDDTAHGSRRQAGTRRLSLVLLAVSVVVLLAGLVVLYYRLIPPPVAAHTIYRDPGHRFHFTQPALWHTTTYPAGVVLADGTGISTAWVSVTAPDPGEDASMRAKGIAQGLGLTMMDPAELAGATWQRCAGRVSGPNGVSRQLVVLVTLHGGQIYTIEYSTAASSFGATNTLVFQPLLHSFAFG